MEMGKSEGVTVVITEEKGVIRVGLSDSAREERDRREKEEIAKRLAWIEKNYRLGDYTAYYLQRGNDVEISRGYGFEEPCPMKVIIQSDDYMDNDERYGMIKKLIEAMIPLETRESRAYKRKIKQIFSI